MHITTEKRSNGMRVNYYRGDVKRTVVVPYDFALSLERNHFAAALVVMRRETIQHDNGPTVFVSDGREFKGAMVNTQLNPKTHIWVWDSDPMDRDMNFSTAQVWGTAK